MNTEEFIYNSEKICFENGWTQENIRHLLESDGGLYVVDEDERGYVIGNIILDEAELYRIAVLPQHRGQHTGKKLLNEFIELCRKRGAVKVFLEVRSKNVPAISLYEQAGFERISLRKGYYGDDDALIYVLSL